MEPKVIACGTCNVALVPVARRAALSAGGVLGAVAVAAGLVLLLFAPIFGVGAIVVGLLLSSSSGRETVMTCPQCGARGATL